MNYEPFACAVKIVSMKNAAKLGGLFMAGGTLSVLAVMTKGFGPCGPTTALGTSLLLGGVIAFSIGLLLVIFGAGWAVIRRVVVKRAPSEN